MKVLIVGYGRMGREIESVCLSRGHTISGRIDPAAAGADSRELSPEILSRCDIAIEFSIGESVAANARAYAEAGIPAIVGTTGWGRDLDRVRALFNGGGAYLWGTNFSIGAHVFFALAETAARLVSKIPDYDILAYEIHHSEKKDSPSGTALTLGERLLRGYPSKTRIVTERLDRKRNPEEIHIASVRGGSIPGIHTVMLDSAADTVELRHTARNRSGFALGAVMAAEWLRGREGFYTVEDFVTDLFGVV